MAVQLSKATSIHMKVYNGLTESGANKYQTKSIAGINPDISDDDLLKVSAALETLIAKPLRSVTRVDSVDLDNGSIGE